MAADLVALIHFAFVLFVVLGGLLALRWRRVIWVHLPAAVWGALIELTGGVCPLTPLENWLRHKAGGLGFSGGFIEHYLIPVLYPAGLTRPTQIGLGLAVIVVNVALYLWIFVRSSCLRHSR
jgi:hypothetical protein